MLPPLPTSAKREFARRLATFLPSLPVVQGVLPLFAHSLRIPWDTPKKVAIAQALYDDKNNAIDDICKTLNISRATLYRYITVKKG